MPNTAPRPKKEVTAEERAEMKSLLSRISQAERKMQQAKNDIFTDAQKRVTKGNIIKKKNDMLREELHSSHSHKNPG